MNALTNNVVKTVKEFLYADNLILRVDDWKKEEEKYVKWEKNRKQGDESKYSIPRLLSARLKRPPA